MRGIGMRALVTGSTGLLGDALVRELLVTVTGDAGPRMPSPLRQLRLPNLTCLDLPPSVPVPRF